MGDGRWAQNTGPASSVTDSGEDPHLHSIRLVSLRPMQDPRDDHRFPIGSALTRRTLLQTLAAAAAPLAFGARVQAAQSAQAQPTGGDIGPLNPSVLPPGVRSRFVDGVNGLRM